MTRRLFIKGFALVMPTLRFIGGQYVDVAIELQAAALRGELDGTEDYWAGGDIVEEMSPLPEKAKWGPIVGLDGKAFTERAQFNGVSC